MRLTVSMLDDDKGMLLLASKMIERYNKNNYHDLDCNTFTSSVDFIMNFNHDIAVIDLDIKGVNGFQVGERILRENQDTVVFMMSGHFMSDEKDESLICKMNFDPCDLVERYFFLRHREVRNVRQILNGQEKFKNVLAV